MKELVPLFIEESGKILLDIKNSAESQDMDAFESSTHTLKGSAGNMGAERLFLFMKELNDGAKDKLWPEHENWTIVMDDIFQKTQVELEKINR